MNEEPERISGLIKLPFTQPIFSVRSAAPDNVNAMLKHKVLPWLTLVTCKGYDEQSGRYQSRVLVRAVLKEIM